LPREVEELEITEEFPKLIKKAREKNRMSQQDLAEAVKERLTIIQKIELGKMAPNLRLTHAIEHVLRIKLLLPRKEPEIPVDKMDQSELTLGDVIQYKKKTV
jgi:putative transcription factor